MTAAAQRMRIVCDLCGKPFRCPADADPDDLPEGRPVEDTVPAPAPSELAASIDVGRLATVKVAPARFDTPEAPGEPESAPGPTVDPVERAKRKGRLGGRSSAYGRAVRRG